MGEFPSARLGDANGAADRLSVWLAGSLWRGIAKRARSATPGGRLGAGMSHWKFAPRARRRKRPGKRGRPGLRSALML